MFSDILRKTRREADLTQKEMAKALDMTQAGYSKWEKGLTTPNPDKLKQVAELLNVSVEYLLKDSPLEPQVVSSGDNNNIKAVDYSHFNHNNGTIDINNYSNHRNQEEIDADQNIISLLEEILEQQKLLIDILKNK